ncbi:acyltransferase family protein [Corynebacterium mastitidis]|uniref:Acyltransferase family protein n=1 Tax=Corynebacterium mastitidis TaxID=161890 RepID=A0ABU8NY03_9CORY
MPGLDGLRGIAVLGVVVYHYFPHALPGGFLGVDVFFVLSGFLITALLLREKVMTGRISLTGFWLRRVRRILPLAMVVLIVTTAVVGVIGGDVAVRLRSQFVGVAFFINNWVQIAQGNSYFDQATANVTMHYWSLAIEEQYYLLWPLVVMGVLVIMGRRRVLAAVAVGLAVASALAMVVVYVPGTDASRVYYGTDTHAFGLLLGSALAAAITSTSSEQTADSFPLYRWLGVFRHRWVNQWVPAGCLTALVMMMVMLSDASAMTYRGGLAVACVLTAVIVMGLVCGGNVTEELCTVSVLRWLGDRSFSLYLWHWPVFVVAGVLLPHDTGKIAVGAVSLVVSLVLSQGSYCWIERPIVARGYRGAWRGLLVRMTPRRSIALGAGSATLLAGTVYGLVTAPAAGSLEEDLSRYSAQLEQQSDAAAARPTATPRKTPEATTITMLGDSVMLAASEALSEEFPDTHIDAEVGRHYAEAATRIEELSAQGALGEAVVLGLGTNGPSDGAGDQGVLDRIHAAVGEERALVYVLPYGDRSYMADAEAEILSDARVHENTVVADWCHAARDNAELLREDRIHPSTEGGYAYARAIREAMEQWATGEKKVPEQCGV